MKEDYQKPLKKITLFFLLNPVSFNGQSYQKQKGPGTSNLSLLRLRSKFTKISLLIMYYLTKCDIVIQSGFWVIPNFSPSHLCKLIHDIINYSTCICPFKSGKCWKEEEKLQKIEYLRNKKSFLGKVKTFFTVFEGLSLGEKIKIW